MNRRELRWGTDGQKCAHWLHGHLDMLSDWFGRLLTISIRPYAFLQPVHHRRPSQKVRILYHHHPRCPVPPYLPDIDEVDNDDLWPHLKLCCELLMRDKTPDLGSVESRDIMVNYKALAMNWSPNPSAGRSGAGMRRAIWLSGQKRRCKGCGSNPRGSRPGCQGPWPRRRP